NQIGAGVSGIRPFLTCRTRRPSPHDDTRKRSRLQKNPFYSIQTSNILSYILNARKGASSAAGSVRERHSRTKGRTVATHNALTSRQKEIYDFIRQKMETRGYPPTVREIGNAFDIKSPNGVMCHLNALVKKGLIEREAQSARAIQIVGYQGRSAQQAELPMYG